ncbi:hypothetical protein D3C81_1092660 [compost metagenome]
MRASNWRCLCAGQFSGAHRRSQTQRLNSTNTQPPPSTYGMLITVRSWHMHTSWQPWRPTLSLSWPNQNSWKSCLVPALLGRRRRGEEARSAGKPFAKFQKQSERPDSNSSWTRCSIPWVGSFRSLMKSASTNTTIITPTSQRFTNRSLASLPMRPITHSSLLMRWRIMQ